jgi:hypothetical protein
MVSNKNSRPKRQQPISTRKNRVFLPWPIITFILLTLGVLLLGWTFQTQADDIHVTAKVSAPLPSGAAVITEAIKSVNQLSGLLKLTAVRHLMRLT